MELYIVDTFTSSSRINDFHYLLYHGLCRKEGEQYPSFPAHKFGDDLSRPMLLSRNCWLMPDIFKPTTSTSLVVSATVKNRLGALSNVVYLPVVFEKLVEFPFAAGDFSYFETPEYSRDPFANDHATLIERLPDVPNLHREVGSYFELISANYHKIKDRYPARREVRFSYPYYLGGEKPARLEVTREMLVEHPVLWSEYGIVFVGPVFCAISEYLDRDYFTVTNVTD